MNVGFSGKLIIDGTVKLPAEGEPAPPPVLPEAVSHSQLRRQHSWPGLLAVTINKTEPGQARRLARELLSQDAVRGVRLLLITSDEVDPADPEALMWLTLANLDPARDAWLENTSSGSVLVLDGTVKLPAEGARPWPQIARLSDDVLQRVAPLAEKIFRG